MGYCIFLRKGETHTTPSAGILASDLAVGDIVKLTEGGTPVEYIVVNQGIPGSSSLYDDSCDGTWLLRKDCHSSRVWNSSNINTYASSDINTWLNGDFFNGLGSAEQAAIKQVKIPYCLSGMDTAIKSGVNGLGVKVFLVSGYEVGLDNYASIPEEGVKLDYFESGTGTSAKNKRIAYRSGLTVSWWLRSPYINASDDVCDVTAQGNFGSLSANNSSDAVRPALILPFTAKFDETTKILKG